MSDDGKNPGDGDEDREEQDREAILARRARFVATALIGISVLPGCDPFARSQPCLSIEPVRSGEPDAGQDPPPMPCLSPVPNPPPSASSAAPPPSGSPQPCLEIAPQPPPTASNSAGGPADAGPPPPPPQPCLSVVRPPPPPQPCLTPVRPKPQNQ